MYCQIHSYQINESFKPLLFISELEEIRRKAYNLEKILVIIQERKFYYQSPNVSNDLLISEKRRNDFDPKYQDLVNNLKVLQEKVDYITKNSKLNAERNERFKHQSLNIIKGS